MRLPALQRGMLCRLAYSQTEIWRTICLLVTVGFIALCVASFFVARSDADQRARIAASDTASILSYDVARIIERFDHVLGTTSARLQSHALQTQDETARNLMLFGPSGELRQLGFIEVLDQDGRVVESVKTSELGSAWSHRDYFTAQSANPQQGLFIGRPFGEGEYASIPLSRRLTGNDGTFAGVVVASLRLSYLRELFAQANAGPSSSIALLRQDGTELTRSPSDRDDSSNGKSLVFVARQIGDLPLSLRVGVAAEDMVGSGQVWSAVMLLAGVTLGLVCAGSTGALQREIWKRQAAEKDQQRKSDYLAMTSHELHTPLQAIISNAEHLRFDARMDPVNARQLIAILSSVRHLRSVIDRVLNYLHVEARLPIPRMGRVALEKLLDQCCIMIESDTAAKGLDIRYGFKAGAPEEFVTDEDLLRQVLVNLLGNAVKFTEQGQVVIEVGGTSERITIEVIDTGCGIPPEQRCKLFKQGERLGAERFGIPGYGIGLAMSRRLVQAMGGNIGFRENPAGGSIFWIGLPSGTLAGTKIIDMSAIQPFRFSDFEQYILDLARKIEILLQELKAPHGVIPTATLMTIVHDVSQRAEALGFVELSATARDFAAACSEESPSLPHVADALANAARATLVELRELTSAGVVGPQ